MSNNPVNDTDLILFRRAINDLQRQINAISGAGRGDVATTNGIYAAILSMDQCLSAAPKAKDNFLGQLYSFAGSPNIATVGTITTGEWKAVPIAPQYGGNALFNHANFS